MPPAGLRLTAVEVELYPVIYSAIGIALIGYAAYLPVFVFFDEPEVAVVNAFMVGWLGAAMAVGRRGMLTPALAMGAWAVVGHGFVAVAAMGWEPGFHYPIVMGLLLLALLASISIGQRIALAALQAGAYLGLALFAELSTPFSPLSPMGDRVFKTLNLSSTVFTISVIGLYYSYMVQRTRRQRDAAENELRDALERSAAVVENMADGLVVFGPRGSVLARNGSLHALVGDAIPEPLVTLGQRAMSEGEVVRCELALDSERFAAAVASPLFADGAARGAVVLVRDVTADKEVDRMKTEFTAVVSHELRTPLTSILGFTKLVRKGLERHILPATSMEGRKVEKAVRLVRSNLDVVAAEGERLAALIDDVLDVAKMEAGRMEFAAEAVEPAELVARAEAATTGLFADTEVQLRSEVAAELPTLTGDPDRLQQVLVNLISNAAKFSSEGEVVLAATRCAAGVRLSVTDRGPGIAPEDHEAIFDKFQQVGGSGGDKPKGTGLGLPICKQIVDAHAGSIRVRSELGEGATFVVELPIAE